MIDYNETMITKKLMAVLKPGTKYGDTKIKRVELKTFVQNLRDRSEFFDMRVYKKRLR